MPEKGAAIMNMGMITAVGLDAEQTAASVRAGITRFSETSIHNKRFVPFTMAILPDEVLPPLEAEIDKLTGLTSRQIRMLRLAAPALQAAAETAPDIERIPLYLGVPEALPGRPDPVDDKFLEHLSLQSGVKFNVAESKLFPKGRAAGLLALKEAIEFLESGGNVEYVIVGGVDTYLDLYLLGTLDMQDRILVGNVMDGFIPGEGAGFLLLTGLKNAMTKRLSPLALLTPVASGFEEGHFYSEQPYKGDGLATALSELFAESGIAEPVNEVYSAMNGENHWAKEWGVAFMRNKSFFDPGHGMHHPADCYGDTGAASGILLTALAAIGMKEGYRKSPALVTCSSDYGERAGVAIVSPS